jgi:DNA-directed RNA polymerase specialized sigma24 family protein
MADWEQSFEELLARRGGALRAYAYLLTGDSAAAADLVQDGLLKVFSRMRVGNDIAQLEGYVRRAMLNQFVDGHRRAGGVRGAPVLRGPDRPRHRGSARLRARHVKRHLSDAHAKLATQLAVPEETMK